MEARDDVVVGEVDLTELRRRLRDGQRRERAGRPVPFEQRAEVDVDELVAVHREHVAVLGSRAGRVPDPATAAEPLGLARADELDAEPREAPLELSPPARRGS